MERPKNKQEYREQLAQMFINSLNENGLAWKKQWHGAGTESPFNGVTKGKYRGCNQLLLHLVSLKRGYRDPRWVTMVQIMDQKSVYHPNEKWHLKKGTKAVYVEYWYPYDLVNKKAFTWKEYQNAIQSGRKETEFILNTRYTAVFNADEVEGMPKLAVVEHVGIKQEDLIDKLSAAMAVPILHDGGDSAFYYPKEDSIHVPEIGAFESSYAYNSTVLHELAHATGHSTRLHRNLANGFGTEAYAYEELIAEMTSCFLSAEFLPADGNESKVHLDNHKAYIRSWIRSVKEKPETLIKAVKEAQTAASYMDYKAELIDEAEYQSVVANMKVRKTNDSENLQENEAEVPARAVNRISVRERIRRAKEEPMEQDTFSKSEKQMVL